MLLQKLSILPEYYMKKIVQTVILSVLAFFLFLACKNYTADIDDYLSYWSAKALITDYTLNPPPQTDAEGVRSVSSKTAVTVTFTVHNPKNFDFKMPADSGAPADIIRFPHIRNVPDKNAALTLQHGIDYEFKKISHTKLALTYTPAFLRKYEWGGADIAPFVILYTTDGRQFKQDFHFALKVNTPPPAIAHYAVAKTKTNDPGKDAYYVFCLQKPYMDVTVTGGFLHKDIAGIEINGTTYPLSVNEEQHSFIKPKDTAFLDITDVEKLEANAGNIPSGWVLYFKTDVPVKEGSSQKGYTVKLKDAKGLTSSELKASTEPNKLKKAILTVTKGVPAGTGNGTASSPIIIGTEGDGAAVMISSQTPNTTVHCMLTEVGQAPAPEQTGSPSVTVALPLHGANEKTYKLEYYTDGEGFTATAQQTSYYKIVLKHTVTFNLAGGNIDGNTNVITMTGIPGTAFTKPVDPIKEGYTFNGWNPELPASPVFPAVDTEYTAQWTAQAITVTTWEALRTAVQDASDGAVIEIAGNLTYTIAAAGGKKSTITVNRDITIRSTEGNTYTLDASGTGANGGTANNKVTGIFEVEGGKTLTLENLKLTKTEKYAVYVAEDSSLKMKNVTINDCKTNDNAAGIYFNKGKDLTLENCTIEKCKGKGSQSSGGIDIQGPKKTVSIKDTAIKNCEANGANSTGGGIHLYNVNNAQCTLENVTVDSCSALSGGGVYAEKGTLTISGGSFTENTATSTEANGGGGAIYNKGSEITITNCIIGGDNGNMALRGAGIFVSEDAKCILKAGVKIKSNIADGTNPSGGGIFVDKTQSGSNAGILTIEGTERNPVIISGNTADYGGGLYSYGKADIKYAEIQGNSVENNGGGMFNAGTCMMDSVTVKDNTASHQIDSAGQGGGIFSNKKLTLKNTTITGNTAKMDGGAIYINGSAFNLSGSSVITVEPKGNVTDPSKNDIYLTNDAFITLTGALTATRKIARITLNSSGGYQKNREIVKGDSDFTIPLGYDTKFEITDKIGSPQHWKLIYQSNALKLKRKQ